MNLIYRDTLIQQLLELGVQPGGVLSSTAFSKVKPIEGGPVGLISALHSALGPQGTLVMPSMSYEDDLPFHKTKSHCAQLGVTADTFWRLPGVLRSDNNHAFAAVGPQAERITAPHPIDIPHGLDSPVGEGLRTGRAGATAGRRPRLRIRPSTCAEYGGSPLPAGKIPHDPEGWGAGPLNTAKSTTAVRISPWWMAGLMNADCKGGERSVMQRRASSARRISWRL